MLNIYFAFYIYPFLIPFEDKRWFPSWPLSAPCLLCTGRLMHLYAVCVDCLEGVHKIICIKCKSRWDGSWHQLGTMYTYDILAASPCCQVCIDPTGQEVGDIELLSPSKHRGARRSNTVRLGETEGTGTCFTSEQSRSSSEVQQWWLIYYSVVQLLLDYDVVTKRGIVE